MPNTVGLHPRLALVPSRPVAEEVAGWPAWLLTAKDIVEAALVAAQDGTTARRCMTPETWLEQWRTAHRGTSAFAAAATNASASTSQPRMPRLVMQTTRNASAAATASLPRSEWMRSWRRLNPEYEHVLLDDADGRDFVLRFGWTPGASRTRRRHAAVARRPAAAAVATRAGRMVRRHRRRALPALARAGRGRRRLGRGSRRRRR